MKIQRFCCLLCFVILFFFSCTSAPKSSDLQDELQSAQSGVFSESKQDSNDSQQNLPSRLVLTFGGDIMAHVENFRMKDYSLIYEDIEEILQNDGLSFANLETPVHEGRPYETYPTFNVQPPYAQAAIDAGFDVFSLANNHTNDQGYEGMERTLSFFQSKEKDGVYAAGIKPARHEGFTYQLIEKDGWKVLFVAVTEILNQFTDYQKIDYVSPSASRRKTFAEELTQLRKENPCDVFILSVHTCEDEYVHEITQERRNFYRSLLDAGVDIVWANHPHLAKEWEVFTKPNQSHPHAIVMYALGNTISGQRRDPQFTKPETNRDYTGDGYLIQVIVEKDAPPSPSDGVTSVSAPPEKDKPYEPNFRIVEVTPHLITTYIDEDKNYVIRQLNDEFIQELRDKENEKWANYLVERKKLMEKIGRVDVVD